MNSTFYIFGKFNGSYAQFPVDYTQEIFQQLPNRSSFANTQLVIHREGNLMYYSYMRKLEQENYIGFCLLLNDAMITEIPALFELFDNGISHLALNGEIVKINDNGDIVSNTDSLLSNRQTIQQIANNMMRDLNHFVETRKKLPAQSIAISQDEIKRFDISDDTNQIIESALSYAYVFITKDDDSQNIDSYRSTIKRLKEENEKLQEAARTQMSNTQVSNSINETQSPTIYALPSTQERHGCVTTWLWIVIASNLIGSLYYVAEMFNGYSYTAMGYGLLSACSLATSLGGILLWKWYKCGFYLFAGSAIISSLSTIFFPIDENSILFSSFIGILIWWAILQIRKNGQSAWSLLEDGWAYNEQPVLFKSFFVTIGIVLFLSFLRYAS
ncbi:MAG: hypothetical protein SO287_06480 [Parabacteroides sp.]|nr:hypothetical protein [Parabacteroides sp.]